MVTFSFGSIHRLIQGVLPQLSRNFLFGPENGLRLFLASGSPPRICGHVRRTSSRPLWEGTSTLIPAPEVSILPKRPNMSGHGEDIPCPKLSSTYHNSASRRLPTI